MKYVIPLISELALASLKLEDKMELHVGSESCMTLHENAYNKSVMNKCNKLN